MMIIQLSSLLDWVCSPDGTHNDKIGDREAASESLEKSIWTVGLLFQWVKPIMTKLPGFKTPSHWFFSFHNYWRLTELQFCTEGGKNFYDFAFSKNDHLSSHSSIFQCTKEHNFSADCPSPVITQLENKQLRKWSF